MKNQIKNEQAKWMRACAAGDVAEMLRCSERIEQMMKIQNLLRRANVTLAPMIVGGL